MNNNLGSLIGMFSTGVLFGLAFKIGSETGALIGMVSILCTIFIAVNELYVSENK